MPDVYKCPYGCETSYPITTLRGWKRHMSAKHGRFTEAQLEEASKGSVADDVQTRMQNFSDSLGGGTGASVPVDTATNSAPGEPSAQPATPPEPTTRKVRATPKHLTQLLIGIPEKVLQALDIQPDREDRQALGEAADFLQDIFGVNFEVDESKTTIRSRWWAFLWVGGIMALVYVKHKSATLFQVKPTEIPPEQEPVN